jgi:hypothetical protein
MTYDAIDAALKGWAATRGLQLFSEYRDEPVRSMEVVGRTGMKVQIWVDPPHPDGTVDLHAWDYRDRIVEVTSSVDDMTADLDRLIDLANKWISNG